MTTATPTDKPARLVSLDAYRGFVMLAMASSGLAFANVVENNPDLLTRFDGKPYGPAWRWTWETLALGGLVAACLVIVRACPNSMELPLERIGALPQVSLAAATAASVLLMNYGSKFLYFQF